MTVQLQRRAMRTRRWLLRNVHGVVGMALLATVIVTAVGAPFIAPHDPNHQNVVQRLLPPAWSDGGDPMFLLGTDHLGRDVLSRILHGGQISLYIGVLATTVSATVGILAGLFAGYFRGLLETIIMRVADIQIAFPFLVIAIAMVAAMGAGTWTLIIVLAVWSWVPFARVMHGIVMTTRQRDYVAAASAMGATTVRILFRHVLPNVLPPITVIWTFSVAQVIIAESSLSFLGMGVPPQIPSWGSMLSDGRSYLSTSWWVAVFPALAVSATVLSVNVFGDWIREKVDPRLGR